MQRMLSSGVQAVIHMTETNRHSSIGARLVDRNQII